MSEDELCLVGGYGKACLCWVTAAYLFKVMVQCGVDERPQLGDRHPLPHQPPARQWESVTHATKILMMTKPF